ncbi:MAG: hypothetical protein H8E40_13860 [Chloroflexi bacterium]|nr:hypothetical protein [Chloroflexota bacterium]
MDKKKGLLAPVLCLILVFSATGGLATERVRVDGGEKLDYHVWYSPQLEYVVPGNSG